MDKYRMLQGEARYRRVYRALHLDRSGEGADRYLQRYFCEVTEDAPLGWWARRLDSQEPGARGRRLALHTSVPFKW